MRLTISSVVEARQLANDPQVHLLWVKRTEATRFQERGWVRLEPPRDDAVMFVHRKRQQESAAAASTDD